MSGVALNKPRTRASTATNDVSTAARSYLGGASDFTALITVVREIPNLAAIRACGTPSPASLLINAQSSNVITLPMLGCPLFTGETVQFSGGVDTLATTLWVSRRADELDALLSNPSPTSPACAREETNAAIVWDPETDAALMTPKVVSSNRLEQDWCCITYIGGIYAINKREGRGATASEVRHYAQKAGYKDGRSVTAWSKGNGATQNDRDKHRWVTQAGVDYWVKGMAQRLGIELPADLAEPWQAPEFRAYRQDQQS